MRGLTLIRRLVALLHEELELLAAFRPVLDHTVLLQLFALDQPLEVLDELLFLIGEGLLQ